MRCKDLGVTGFPVSEMRRCWCFEQRSAVICCSAKNQHKGINPMRELMIIQARGSGDETAVATLEGMRRGQILDQSGR